ncbi:MAG: hypothetical protein CVV41_14450 [Candidatus Riflebacteria bacterium HGW-Riflebacteria-1]|jgi:hypothetical protein|nr:MAG: hypothetical protein CVV41_14450 [Candidatus Riflebacteria bacterium HGW-Riflebacteria-1]
MRFKTLFSAIALFLLLAGAVMAYSQNYQEMINKYGPVPEAILEPPVAEVIASEKSSLMSKIFGGRALSRAEARTKACYAYQRVTMGAVEMYNMDNATMYKTLNFSDVADARGMLVTAKYVKSPMVMPEPSCHLRSYGDLSDSAVIYCDYHGCIPDEQQELRKAAGYTPKVRAAKTGDNTMLAVFVILGVLSVGVMIVLNNVLPKAPKS